MFISYDVGSKTHFHELTFFTRHFCARVPTPCVVLVTDICNNSWSYSEKDIEREMISMTAQSHSMVAARSNFDAVGHPSKLTKVP